MSLVTEAVVSVLLLIGSAFTLVGAIGLFRLPDFFMRLHGPTKSTTLGVGSIVIASMVFFSVLQPGWSLHEVLVTAFLFLTAPISAHMLGKAAIQQRLEVVERTSGKERLRAAAGEDDGQDGGSEMEQR